MLHHSHPIYLLYHTHSNLVVMPETSHLLSLHSRIRDRDCSRSDFIFYADQLIRLLCEYAFSTLEFKDKSVETPTEAKFMGCELAREVCGVSIMRAGESMETALRNTIRNVTIGKLLIQRDEKQKDKPATLFYSKLPKHIKECQVLLMDPMLASGNSCSVAVKCLVEAGIPPSSITFVNLVSCPEGVTRILKDWPEIKLVTGMVDSHLNDEKFICPGIGDFGDRYFGTEE